MNKPMTFALLTSLALAACATAPEATPALDGTHWTLASADKGALANLAANSGITLSFSSDAISGYGGCNQYRADYTLAAGVLTAGAVGATKRYCAGDGSNAEKTWFALLGGPLTLSTTADALELRGADGTVLRFTKGAAPTQQ